MSKSSPAGLVLASASDLRLDRQLCFRLYAASNLVTRLYRPFLDPLGLTYPQYLVMMVLWEKTPQSVKSLSERLFLDSGTLTPMLKRMEASGLVLRSRDHEDERRVLIDLTANGRALRAQALTVPQRIAACTGLTADAASGLRDMLDRLVGHLATTEDGEAAVMPSQANAPVS